MPWTLIFILSLLLAFVGYSLDVFYKLQQDIKYIRHQIEKMNS